MELPRTQEWERLRNTVAQWNDNRLDLFELSEPDDQLNFHGVMRFYYQDSGQKVSTKCIRVSSELTAQDVIDVLMEKFRPDMRMLSTPRYALYEIHESGEERQLGMEERPLHVQLNWHQDDREGRFLLRNLNHKYYPLRPTGDTGLDDSNFKRKLSKREKKELKKKGKLQKMKSGAENEESVAEKLYTELPETSFTRSISNPEAVMRRRRQQKLEKKLQQFRSRDGGPDTGGTLKIYGESLCSDVPYKTLLLSISDCAAAVVREMLQKYGKYREDPSQYCLLQVVTQEPQQESREYRAPTGPYNEYILEDDECPLAIIIHHPPTTGSIMFHVRKRPHDYQPRKRKKMPSSQPSVAVPAELDGGIQEPAALPFLVELNSDGSEVRHTAPRRYSLRLNVTEVGSERSPQAGGQCLQLAGHNMHPRHCVIAHTEGIVTVTPCGREAETYVNGQRVYETTILQHGCVVQFGRVYKFRFLDPAHDDRLRVRQPSRPDVSQLEGAGGMGARRDSMETTFDVTGNVETRSTASHRQRDRGDDALSTRSDARAGNYASFRRGSDPILPAVLEFREETEDAFLRAVITRLEPVNLQFKLAPTYTLYMAARFRASTHYRSDLSPNERAVRLTSVLAKVASLIADSIQMRRSEANALAFWMANASEYLHFLKQDRHISAYSRQAQEILAESVQSAFWYVVDRVEVELSGGLGGFLEDREDGEEEEGTTGQVLATLANTMALLRRCRVNAALTIQLFSQLFHYINLGVFNRLVMPGPVNYCSRRWGERLKRRLGRTELWADRQGLELAADCHLGRVVQAAHLLTAPKNNVDDLTGITSTCYKLNSLQLRAMLEKYQPAEDEPASIPPQLVDNIVRIAESTSDELARQDGRPVRLEESRELQLPFLLPEDGYSSDIVRGIPNGLSEFIAPLQHAGLARMSEQPSSWGYWTIYMAGQDNARLPPRSPSAMSNRSVGPRVSAGPPGPVGPQPQLQVIRLHKSNSGLGLSIVAAKGAGQEQQGIYVKSVVRGGAADADGRLAAGDLLLEVDGHSLVGISQEQAAEYMMHTGPVVVLRVAKQAAVYHRLTTLLSQPSPTMSRGSRRASERANVPPSGRIQSSKSVPVLSADGDGEPAAGHQQESYNPGFNLSASNASLAALSAAPPPPPAHLRSRSVQNLHKPPAVTAGGPAPPPRPMSVHSHQQQPPVSAARSEMPRSASEQEHLRYRHDNTSGEQQAEVPAAAGCGAQYANTAAAAHTEPAGLAGGALHGSYRALNGGEPRLASNGGADPALNGQQRGSHSEQPPAQPQLTSSHGDHSQAQFTSSHGDHSQAQFTSSHGDHSQAQFTSSHGDHSQAQFTSSHGDHSQAQFTSSHGDHSQAQFTSSHGDHSQAQFTSSHDDHSQAQDINSQSEPLNIQSDFRNSQSDFRNSQSDFRNSQSDFRNSQSDFRNSQSDFRNSQSDFRNSQSDFRKNQGDFRNSQRDFRNSQSEIQNSQVDFRSSQSDFHNSQSDFRHNQGDSHVEGLFRDSQSEYGQSQLELGSSRAAAEPGLGEKWAPEPAPARPPPPQQLYGQELPPPPPPPSTHPLYGQSPTPQRPPPPSQLSNPWSREQREQEAARRTEAARHWRDQHIARLQAVPQRTRRQQQQLDTLLLEQRFQQRMELGGDDDDTDDQPEQEQEPAADQPSAAHLSPSSRQQEVLRRQAQLEAAQQAEQGILREAQRRRDQELEAAGRPPPPPPPGRTVSFGAVTTPRSGELRAPAVPPKPEVAMASVVSTRRLQLSEPSAGSAPAQHEDPDRFLDEAEQLMAASSVSPPSLTAAPADASWTPGVIGAQEVYRDPRTRRLAMMQDRHRPDVTPVPEKLSFKEKMKMFAAETS